MQVALQAEQKTCEVKRVVSNLEKRVCYSMLKVLQVVLFN